ncbi:hypothetical protein TruAng_006651 [Truncatella angustata]|nr:hypothetical protein TruAng_006651 [Truncatella angustata]
MTAALWRAEHSALEYSIQVEGIHQKGEAMREIRTKLAHAESVGNDDDMNFLMATMSTLGIVETCDGDFEAAETHLRGVQDLFSSRGGHDSLKDDFVLCKSINLADIQVAVALGHRLRFPLLHTDQAYLPASILEQAWHPPLDHSILNDSSYYHVRIFVQIRQLLLARQSSVVSLDALRTLLNMADDAILSHLYQDSTDVSDVSRRSRALVLAAHVFTRVDIICQGNLDREHGGIVVDSFRRAARDGDRDGGENPSGRAVVPGPFSMHCTKASTRMFSG